MTRVRERIEVDGLAGWRFVEDVGALVPDAARWLREGHVPDALEVRPGRLYRRGAHAIKLFGRARRLRIKDRLPRSPALRFADQHERLKPIHTPRPVLALDLRQGGKRRRSLLVYEWVEGRFLADLWEEQGPGVAAFPAFVAAMHEQGVWHGDFHLHNALWDGAHWFLIDLDSLRHPLRNLRPARLAEDHWAHIWLWLDAEAEVDEADVRGLFERYCDASTVLTERDASWQRIRRGLEALVASGSSGPA